MKELEDILIAEKFSGVVLITKNNRQIYQKTSGFADISNKISNKLDTKFQIASGNKIFTAIAILQLVQSGKISLNITIGEIFDFDLYQIDKKITIEQLLTHTSGIPDYFDEDIMKDYTELWENFPNYKIRNISSLLPLFIKRPMIYAPGLKFKYSNSGYVILGLVIEKISGMAYDKYIDKNILKPADMFNTGCFELDRLPANCANAYMYDEKNGEYYSNIYSFDVKGGAAGGAFTTVSDINIFWQKLLNNEFLSREITSKMLSAHAKGDEDFYGYGVWLKNDHCYFIEGCDPGVCFYSSIDIESGVGITFLNNNYKDVWKYAKMVNNYI